MSREPKPDEPLCRRCHGATREWAIVHPVEHDGQTVIVEGVPARVCFACGDTRISDATRTRLERLLKARPVAGTIPFREWRE